MRKKLKITLLMIPNHLFIKAKLDKHISEKKLKNYSGFIKRYEESRGREAYVEEMDPESEFGPNALTLISKAYRLALELDS